MARIRTIPKNPPKKRRNYYVVDACFLADKYIPIKGTKGKDTQDRLRRVKRWWKEIDRQAKDDRARVYVPDLCIAEAFKVLAKKNFQEDVFSSASSYKYARDKLQSDVTMSHKDLKSKDRKITCHDLPATRDIIIAVDRFNYLFLTHKKNVGVIDLIVVASAKYLMDFYDIPKSQLHIITMDKALWQGIKKISEIPNAYDPVENPDSYEKTFK